MRVETRANQFESRVSTRITLMRYNTRKLKASRKSCFSAGMLKTLKCPHSLQRQQT